MIKLRPRHERYWRDEPLTHEEVERLEAQWISAYHEFLEVAEIHRRLKALNEAEVRASAIEGLLKEYEQAERTLAEAEAKGDEAAIKAAREGLRRLESPQEFEWRLFRERARRVGTYDPETGTSWLPGGISLYRPTPLPLMFEGEKRRKVESRWDSCDGIICDYYA